MKRVVVESQNNPLFRGKESEQAFDQRGGLCQVGEGDIVVTTSPIDPTYLKYWKGLGFTLPLLIEAGPFDPRYTLSELIAQSASVQERIKTAVNGSLARIEPFWVDSCDAMLPTILGIPIYCNPEFFIEYACKYRFKQLCEEVGLLTAPWVGGFSVEEVIEAYRRSDFKDLPALIKAANSTGGLDLGTIVWAESADELAANRERLGGLMMPLVVERAMDVWTEVTIHWEIFEDQNHRVIGVFDQHAENHSYAGAGLPTSLPRHLQQRIIADLEGRLIPAMKRLKAKGFFCCDLLVLENECILWTDFNPRKGAILYIHDMALRLGMAQGWSPEQMHLWHAHASLPRGCAFAEVEKRLGQYLRPSSTQPFVVITNPGTLPYGGVDLTGIALTNRTDAKQVVAATKALLLN